MKTEHTATPWGIEETDSTIWVGPLKSDGSGKIAEIVTYFDVHDYKPAPREQAIAKARRIVACVNLMPEVEALLEKLSLERHTFKTVPQLPDGMCSVCGGYLTDLEHFREGESEYDDRNDAQQMLAKLKEAVL